PYALRSPLFPYTTLFRSRIVGDVRPDREAERAAHDRLDLADVRDAPDRERLIDRSGPERGVEVQADQVDVLAEEELHGQDVDLRSEEHTSELQSRSDLVC